MSNLPPGVTNRMIDEQSGEPDFEQTDRKHCLAEVVDLGMEKSRECGWKGRVEVAYMLRAGVCTWECPGCGDEHEENI